jgi:hypothetical protein
MSEFSVNLPPRLPTAGAAASVLTAVVPDPPRHLTQLDNGTILRGTVQGRDPDGLLVVATDKGVIKLATTANLAPGSHVTLEVRATGDRLQVLVLATDTSGTTAPGQAPPRGTGGSTAPPPTPTGGNTAPPQRPVPPQVPVAIVGSIMQGTIVQAAPDTLTQLFRSLLPTPPAPVSVAPNIATPLPGHAAAPAPASTPGQPQAPTANQPLPAQPTGAQSPTQPSSPPLLAGQPVALPAAPAALLAQAQSLPGALASSLQSDVRAKIESLFFASTQTPAAGAMAASGTGAPAAQPQSQNLAASLKLLAALPTGSEVKLRLIAISPGPGQPMILPGVAAASPSIISGRIAGYTPMGHAVLHSPLGTIVLQGNLSVPVGTELSVAIEPALPTPGAATGLSMPQSLFALSRGWPSLADAIALLRAPAGNPVGTQPAVDATAALARLPQTGNRLAAGIVAAIQALGAGDVEALLGGLASLRQASAGREEGARKLRQEFAQISAQAQDKAGVDWRCFFIPVMDDGTIRQINLFYRRDRGKKDKGDDADKTGTRFIVEVDMSKMGPFQFDGLVREKRFDLMVRSHIALTSRMRHDIGTLFNEALELGSYKGNLVFQKVKEFPVSPLDEIEKSATRVSA